MKSIELGNQLALFLVETAFMAVTEPSFQSWDWNDVRDVYSNAVQRRLQRAAKLQRTFKLSDKALFEGLWQGTMETLLAIERLSNEEENESLNWASTQGPFGHSRVLLDDTAGASSATIKFLDEYMRARGSLWAELRRQNQPAVLTIPLPFPRGLRIQSLFPLYENRHKSWLLQTPYLLSRATDIVFCPSSVHQAVPSSKEIRNAIGGYIDSYETALMVYVYSQPKGPGREAHIARAWSHATSILSHGHLNIWEAREFWHIKFDSLDLYPVLGAEEYRNPRFPPSDDPTVPTEWNPDPAHEADEEGNPTAVAMTVLDCLLSQEFRYIYSLRDSKFVVNNLQLQAPHGSHRFWTRRVPGITSPTMPPASRTAIIAAALLYVTESISGHANVLSRPFPTSRDARYPALFLDNDFLDRSDLSVESACEALLSYISEVPSELLRHIAESFETALDDPKFKSKLSKMYALFNLTADSHMPWKFVGLHLRLILDRPDDSSWHRQLLAPRLLDNLPATQAEQVISDIERSILERLGNDKNVKITTLKQFAMMIARSRHVNHTTSLQVLVGLLSKCSHIDVQAVIVQGLIVIFKTSGEEVKSAIVKSLKNIAVELAASIDSHRVIREEEWTKAELEVKAPEPCTDESPIATALLDLALSEDLSAADQQTIVHEVLWPMIRKVRSNKIRWLRIFHAQHGIELPETMVNATIDRKLVERLIDDHLQFITKDVLDDYAAFVFTRHDNFRELQAMHDKLLHANAIDRSKGFTFWRSIWVSGYSAWYLADPIIPRLLVTSWRALPDNGVTRDQVQGIISATIDRLIMTSQPQTSNLIKYLQPFKFNCDRSVADGKLWQQYAPSILRGVISKVAALRTPAWQRNPARQPAFLPDCLELELWLLDYPEGKPHSGSTGQTQAFVMQLSAIIERMTTDGQPYHDRFCLTQRTIGQLIASDYVRLHTAFALSSTVGWKGHVYTLADVLLVDLARTLLESARSSLSKAERADIRDLILMWRECSNEAIRTIAHSANIPVYSLFD
jgi:hypothetical protein